MSILIDETTPIIVQGITGDKGSFHAKEMIEYGTNVVGGVTPGKGGSKHHGLPVFNTVKEAVDATGADDEHHLRAAGLLRPTRIMEAADAGIRLICSITDGIPAQDMMRVKRYLRRYPKEKRPMMVGPELRRHHQPRQGHARHHAGPHLSARQGWRDLALGTLGYEAASQMKAVGIGITTSRRHRRRPDQRLLVPRPSRPASRRIRRPRRC